MRLISLTLTLLLASTAALAQSPRVWFDTELGPIILELDEVNAPVTTENFLDYVDAGFYDGLIFHRVVGDFVIQAGGFNASLEYQEPLFNDIVNESDNGLSNRRGTIGMARTSDPDSANAQFYINTGDNDGLDGSSSEPGYAVFGEVIEGMGTVERINALRALATGGMREVPVRPPLIRRAVQVDGFPIMPLHTASWFDPERAGVGFNVEVTNDASTEQGPVMVVYWYDFSNGQPIWLTGVTDFEWGDDAVTMELIHVAGPNEAADFLTPPPGEDFETWGELTLRFDDCMTGRFQFDSPEYGSGEFVATRLTLPDGASCQEF
ncbi:peptidylprolyl isomerase [Wenzhouxiangella sp. AB-CW3]|uniref:peptidylprolyl isomerase n=1 Tax=Wenzhouxiangella sp. AB-CW3 TaxID=2771012 RepID=UPI00168BE6D9|nr:peptidylprolyl isomerase [Wenzhouxiangella sp. AB-CW3]QOC22865.1 peptidylprolyl isomerase [Wenzhouxiangella sp. AB-CW3]